MEIFEGDYILGFWNVGGSGKSDWLATVIRRDDRWIIESRFHTYNDDKRSVEKFEIPVAEHSEEEVLKRMAKSAWDISEKYAEDVGTQIEFGRVQSTDFDVFLKKLQGAKHLKLKIDSIPCNCGKGHKAQAVVVGENRKQQAEKPAEPEPTDERGKLVAKIRHIFGFMMKMETPERFALLQKRLETEKIEVLRVMLEGAENIVAASNLLGPEASHEAMVKAQAKLKEMGWQFPTE